MQRSSAALLVGLVLVGLTVGGVATWLEHGADAPSDAQFEGAGAGGESAAPGSELSAVREDALVRESSTPAERAGVSTAAERELAEALWVDGRVLFPEGTPLGEEVEVIASGKDFEHLGDYRARVAGDGTFRVAFHKDTRAGWLKIEARHLYLEPSKRIELPADESVVIEPALGARVIGKVLPPISGQADLPEVIGKPVQLRGWGGGLETSIQRTAKVGEDLQFELRGIPPRLNYWITCEFRVWPGKTRRDFTLAPGQLYEFELQFEAGVRLRGVVRDEHGAPLPTTSVSVSVSNDSDQFDGGRSESTLNKEDGSFDLRGVSSGKIKITAKRLGYTEESLELGELVEGQVRDGIELVLRSGNFVAGQVEWPDGRGASNAFITVEGPDSGGARMFGGPANGMNQRVKADGSFYVAGLGHGPYTVSVHARGAESEAHDGERASKSRGPTWHARVEGVTSGTQDLKLVLQPGHAVSGHVVDDLGQPVGRFSIAANKDERSRGMPFDARRATSKRFNSDDGAFTLEGLTEGTWSLRVSSSSHSEGEEVSAIVPGAAPLVIVLSRAAIVSGVVLDPAGQPVDNAMVHISHASEEIRTGFRMDGDATSDAKGRFKIRRAPTGAVKLYATVKDLASSAPLDLTLAPGSETSGVEVRLRAGGRLTGEIRGQGRSVAHWQIVVYGQGRSGMLMASSDESGRFEIAGLTPGSLQLEASAPGGGGAFSGASSARISQKVEIQDGLTTHVVLGGDSEALVTLLGSVRAGTRGIAKARVNASRTGSSSTEGRTSHSATTDAEGNYEMRVAPGDYSFSVNVGSSHLSRHETVPASGSHRVDFEFGVGRIAGRVIRRDGSPVQDVQLSLAFDRENSPQRADVVSGWRESDSEGRFEFKNIGPGNYIISAGSRGWGNDEDQTWGHVEVRVALEAGDERTDLVIELDEGGTVTGSVTAPDGTAIHRAWVRLVDESGRSIGALSARTSEDGSYTIRGVAPGRYSAHANAEDGVSDPTGVITVQSNAEQRVDLVVRPGGRIRVQVEESGGARVGASVTIADVSGRQGFAQRAQWNVAGEGDRTEIGPLPAGEYRLTASNRDGQSASTVVRVESGRTSDARIVLGGS